MSEEKREEQIENQSVGQAENKEQNNSDNDEVVLESEQGVGIDDHSSIDKENSDGNEVSSKSKSKVSFIQRFDYMLYLIIIGTIVTIALGLLSFAEYTLTQDQYLLNEKKEAKDELSIVATKVNRKLLQIQKQLTSYSVEDFKQNHSEIANKIYPESSIELILLPFDSMAISDNPNQGYAFLSMMAQLTSFESDKDISKFDVIKPGSEHESVVVMRHIKSKPDAETKMKEFIVVLRLPKVFVKNMFSGIKLTKGEIQVTQGQGTQYTLYRQSGRSYPLSDVEVLPLSTWKLAYFYSVPELAFSFNAFLLVIVYASVAVCALLFTLFISIRRLKKYVISRKLKAMHLSQNSVLTNKESINNLGQNATVAVNDLKNEPVEAIGNQNPLDENIFTEHGIRGIVGKQITATTMQLLGQAIALELDHHGYQKITVGRDNRESSLELSQALIRGLKSCLLDIYDIGVVASPVCYFHAAEKTDSNAVMITAGSMDASHNGLKVLIGDDFYSRGQLKSLCQGSDQLLSDDLGKVIESNAKVLSGYFAHLRKIFKFKKSYKVVLDSCHSSVGNSVKRLLADLGCNVIQLREEPEDTFEGAQPNPSKPDNLQLLIETVTSEKADIGFFLNSDATALGIISAQGKIIWPDRAMMLLSKDLLTHQKGAKILYDVKSTSSLHDWILEYGGEPELCPSGYIHLHERMRANQALLAGEFCGHYFFRENHKTHDDAIFALLKILQGISNSNVYVFETIPDKISTPEILIPVQPGQLEGIMSKLFAQKGELGTIGIVTLDGIRMEYEDGWGVVRASHTMNALSLRFEADDHIALQRIAEKFKTFVLSVVFVKFPF
ncbi:MAG: hypothetical protein HQL46_01090 [Gammaproteobacteria bacterium]|nr:hypothetical protein [Gammaproteobacteria bacterium]